MSLPDLGLYSDPDPDVLFLCCSAAKKPEVDGKNLDGLSSRRETEQETEAQQPTDNRSKNWYVGFPVDKAVLSLSSTAEENTNPTAWDRFQLSSARNWQTFLRSAHSAGQKPAQPHQKSLNQSLQPTSSPQERERRRPVTGASNGWDLVRGHLLTQEYKVWIGAQRTLDLILQANPEGPWSELVGIDIDFLSNRFLSFFASRPDFSSIEKFPVHEGDWSSETECEGMHNPDGSSAVLVFDDRDPHGIVQDGFSGFLGMEEYSESEIWFDPVLWGQLFGSECRFLVRPAFVV